MSKKLRNTIVAVGAVILSIMPFTQACSVGGAWEKGHGSSSASSSSTYVQGAGGEMVPVPLAKTYAVTSEGNLLDHVTGILGLGTPSAAARASYDANKTRVSETGVADTVTAPMWLAITNVSGQSCDDLISKEAALPDTQRSFFAGVDFTKGPDVLKSSSALDNMVHKLARAGWARNEDPTELSLIKTTAGGQFSGTNATQTRYMVKYICAAMIASLDAQDQ